MKPSHSFEQGFTLIEIMVVIVIMTVMTSLVVLNIGGIDQRRARYGLSVSINTRSSGTFFATSRKSCAFLKEIMPEKEM
jgi:prepilin-type N-terminal cleavage/methylation domain-containing protein